MRHFWFSTAAIATACALGGPAAAQEGRDQAAGIDANEDIIVTARKTRERLQDAPISITALTATELQRRGIDSLADVAKVTPGLNYGDFGDLKLSPTSLRGVVGSAGSAGSGWAGSAHREVSG